MMEGEERERERELYLVLFISDKTRCTGECESRSCEP